MENPLDSAGNAAENIGEGLGGLLRGTARFLEQVTGDAFTAAVVAAVVMFALSLLKGGALVKNTRLYAYGLLCMGVAGLAVLLVIGALPDAGAGIPKQAMTPSADDEYRKALKIGMGENKAIIREQPVTISEQSTPLERYIRHRYYFLLFSVMTFVGLMLVALSRYVPERIRNG